MNQQQQAEAPTPRGKKRFIALGVILVIVISVFISWLSNRNWAATDDAQVAGNLVPITSRVNGYIDSIYVKDNQNVVAGQLLVQLDPRDLAAKLKKSEADLSVQKSQASAATTQVSLVQQTSTAGEAQASATTDVASAAVSAARSQVESARAQVASAQANANAVKDAVTSARSDIETAGAQIESAKAGLESAQADVSSAEAQAQKVSADASRAKQLYASGAIAKAQLDAAVAADASAQAALKSARQRTVSASAAIKQAQASYESSRAGLKQAKARSAAANAIISQMQASERSDEAALREAQSRLAGAHAGKQAADTAPQQIQISKAQNQAASAKIKQSLADIVSSKLQLSYSSIIAPVSGVVSQKSIEPGQYVQPGQSLMAVVPLNNVWVIANFKETQIGRMRPGLEAEIEVDTYHGQKLHGVIDSIGAATGAKFSLLPAENATGNFVKVVQRIPVKVILDKPLPKGLVLRPGMNVTARIHLVSGRG